VKVFLLAAGLGTRLRPLTESMPKCLVPIGGRPLLGYWLGLLEAHGFDEILVNVHHFPADVEGYLRDQPYRVRVRAVREPVLLGSAGTVAANRDWVAGESAFCVIYSDNLSTIDLGEMERVHRHGSQALTMALYESPTPRQCGIAQVDPAGRIVAFVEKPAEPAGNLANGGVYMAGKDVLELACSLWDRRDPGSSPILDFGHDILPCLVGRMQGYRLHGYHLDVGSWENYRRAEKDVASGAFRPTGA
jgi:mannose-1-phosphate guanylyltransferase